jgi:FKBP-type peptidyl-prolyl cis-trans isomerase FkpA
MKKHFLLFGLLLILFSACKKGGFDATKQATIDDNKIKAYIAANHIDSLTKDPSGIYYKFIKLDTGTARPSLSDTVQVSYTGKLLNGTIFDSAVGVTLPLTGVVQGWQIIVPYMTFNPTQAALQNYTRVRLIIPSSLGYGNVDQSGGSVDIPANSILDFTIDLIGFYGPTQ